MDFLQHLFLSPHQTHLGACFPDLSPISYLLPCSGCFFSSSVSWLLNSRYQKVKPKMHVRTNPIVVKPEKTIESLRKNETLLKSWCLDCMSITVEDSWDLSLAGPLAFWSPQGTCLCQELLGNWVSSSCGHLFTSHGFLAGWAQNLEGERVSDSESHGAGGVYILVFQGS